MSRGGERSGEENQEEGRSGQERQDRTGGAEGGQDRRRRVRRGETWRGEERGGREHQPLHTHTTNNHTHTHPPALTQEGTYVKYDTNMQVIVGYLPWNYQWQDRM